MKRIKQEDSKGCGLACLAMVTGESYAEVKRKARNLYLCGMLDFNLFQYLYDEVGMFVRLVRKLNYVTDETRRWWPPEPFAELHIAKVVKSVDSTTEHYVVMDSEGKVVDPEDPEVERTLGDYLKVTWVAGLSGNAGNCL